MHPLNNLQDVSGSSAAAAQAYRYGTSNASRKVISSTAINKPSTNTLRNGIGLAAIFGLGYALRDGLKDGFRRIGDFSNSISNVISVPFSLLFPYFILDNERASLSDGKKSEDDILNKMVYTAASLGFAPNTWGDPLKMGTRSTPHMIATIMNLPHILFSFFSYTGGRFMSFLTALKKHKDPKNYRLEQEFKALFRLGNLGSAQASVVPMSGQFILGWETITDIFKGNFGSVWERFKKEPVSVGLGTLFNSWAWPFEYVGKFFDTTIRTAEQVDSFQSAFQGGDKDGKDSSIIVRGLKRLRDNWHKYSQDPNNPVGVMLKHGRQLSKIEALLLPPIGMVSVVTPVFNKFFRGEFFNREAQEIGGTIGLIDKIFNIGAFFTHVYYTGTYALSVRLPQTITTGTFYVCQALNHFKGKKPGDAGYIEPTAVREKIFNRSSGLVKRISDWAEIKLNKLEKELHPGDEKLITKENPYGRHLRSFHKVLAEEVCYVPLREKYYAIEAASLNNRKPSDHSWCIALRSKYSKIILGDTSERKGEAREALEHYLRASVLLDESQINEFMNGKYKHEADEILKEVEKLLKDDTNLSKYYKTIADKVCYTPLKEKYGDLKTVSITEARKLLEDYLRETVMLDKSQIQEFMHGKYKQDTDAILKEVEKLLNNKINHCTGVNTKPVKEPEVKSGSLIELLTNWGELKKVLLLKSFHVTNSVLPLWIRGFVNVADYGKPDDPFWLRNLKIQETGIREGDVKQACEREFMPVVGYAFQSMGKGLATIWNLLHGRMPQPVEE